MAFEADGTLASDLVPERTIRLLLDASQDDDQLVDESASAIFKRP